MAYKSNKIKTFKVCSGGIQGTSNSVEFNLLDLKVDFKRFNFPEIIDVMRNFSKDKLIAKLTEIDIFSWKEYYKNEIGIIDGTQWQVEIIFFDGSVFISAGDNNFPEEWEKLCKYISQVVKKSFF